MRTILDIVKLKPDDEKLMTSNPEFNKVTEDLEQKKTKYESTVFCVFRNKLVLDDAMNALLKQEFRSKEISIFVSHEGNFLDHPGHLIESKLGEGMLSGIGLGIFSGAVWGWLTHYQVSATFGDASFPPFFSILFFAVIFGMITGVLGALIGRLIPEYDVEKYETTLPDGNILVLVKVPELERARFAREILQKNGGKIVMVPEELRNFQPDEK